MKTAAQANPAANPTDSAGTLLDDLDFGHSGFGLDWLLIELTILGIALVSSAGCSSGFVSHLWVLCAEHVGRCFAAPSGVPRSPKHNVHGRPKQHQGLYDLNSRPHTEPRADDLAVADAKAAEGETDSQKLESPLGGEAEPLGKKRRVTRKSDQSIGKKPAPAAPPAQAAQGKSAPESPPSGQPHPASPKNSSLPDPAATASGSKTPEPLSAPSTQSSVTSEGSRFANVADPTKRVHWMHHKNSGSMPPAIKKIGTASQPSPDVAAIRRPSSE